MTTTGSPAASRPFDHEPKWCTTVPALGQRGCSARQRAEPVPGPVVVEDHSCARGARPVARVHSCSAATIASWVQLPGSTARISSGTPPARLRRGFDSRAGPALMTAQCRNRHASWQRVGGRAARRRHRWRPSASSAAAPTGGTPSHTATASISTSPRGRARSSAGIAQRARKHACLIRGTARNRVVQHRPGVRARGEHERRVAAEFPASGSGASVPDAPRRADGADAPVISSALTPVIGRSAGNLRHVRAPQLDARTRRGGHRSHSRGGRRRAHCCGRPTSRPAVSADQCCSPAGDAGRGRNVPRRTLRPKGGR